MCITFVFIDNSGTSHFRLVIANNRDEFYKRPTAPLAAWEDHPRCLSGLDMQSGRGHGTWLGMHTNGKFGMLHNILNASLEDASKQSRGPLVVNFLTYEITAENYLNNLKMEQFNPFQLVLIESSGDQYSLHVQSNVGVGDVVALSNGVHGISNSLFMQPFQKVVKGKELFKKVIDTAKNSQDLENELLQLLSNRTRFLPDKQLSNQVNKEMMFSIPSRSAIYVDLPELHYGTRTSSVIAIDKNFDGFYAERTMHEPIVAEQPAWDLKRFAFRPNEIPQCVMDTLDHKL